MAYVVTQACLGHKDKSCVEVCPVDCFYEIKKPEYNEKYRVAFEESDDDSDKNKNAGLLVIHPDECINCGACETECPHEAIYEDSAVPEEYQDFIEINEKETAALTDEELDTHRCLSK